MLGNDAIVVVQVWTWSGLLACFEKATILLGEVVFSTLANSAMSYNVVAHVGAHTRTFFEIVCFFHASVDYSFVFIIFIEETVCALA